MGVQIRTHVPYVVTKMLTEGTLVIEASAAFLILSPIFWRWTRFLAAVLVFGLHLGIAAMVNLGIFSYAMMAFEPFLVTEAQWALLAKLVPTRGRARTVFYDVDCGVCWAVIRVLARMDAHKRLRFVPNTDTAALPAGVDAALLDADDPGPRSGARPALDARRRLRRDLRGAAARTPLGLAAAAAARAHAGQAGLRRLRAQPHQHFDVFRPRRLRGAAAARARSAGSAAPETPLRAWFRTQTPFLRELLAAVVFVVLTAEVSVANPSVPPELRFDHRPDWMVAAVMYPHIFEGWSLFSPDAPLTDETVYVDAVTRDGRHVNPYNQIGSRVSEIPLTYVPVRLGHDSFWCDYTLRIPDAGVYHQAFLEWVLRYPERTGNPNDTITRFDAYVVSSRAPNRTRRRRAPRASTSFCAGHERRRRAATDDRRPP